MYCVYSVSIAQEWNINMVLHTVSPHSTSFLLTSFVSGTGTRRKFDAEHGTDLLGGRCLQRSPAIGDIRADHQLIFTAQ